MNYVTIYNLFNSGGIKELNFHQYCKNLDSQSIEFLKFLLDL